MAYMESHCLYKDYTFQLKERLQICIAEEATLRVLKVKTIRSNLNNLIIAGWNFYVCATHSVQHGWHVRNACCREGDDSCVIPQIHRDIEQTGL
jgi:hypothetical protein